MASRETAWAVVTLTRGNSEMTIGRLIGPRPDLALMDVLARLQLEAKRVACAIRLREVRGELYELLDLVGLADLVACDEPRREPERRE